MIFKAVLKVEQGGNVQFAKEKNWLQSLSILKKSFQTILKDVCYENIDCILKLLDESGAENSTVVVLKKTERSFKGIDLAESF